MVDQSGETGLPSHLADLDGWVQIPGLGWLREERPGYWWWHDCEPLRGTPEWRSLRSIDTTTGERHAVLGGSLAGGDLTIGGGSGSIPCTSGCGIHGWVRNGQWVTA